jgi:hypothetical protein
MESVLRTADGYAADQPPPSRYKGNISLHWAHSDDIQYILYQSLSPHLVLILFSHANT